jgi:hypothetical protein
VPSDESLKPIVLEADEKPGIEAAIHLSPPMISKPLIPAPRPIVSSQRESSSMEISFLGLLKGIPDQNEPRHSRTEDVMMCSHEHSRGQLAPQLSHSAKTAFSRDAALKTAKLLSAEKDYLELLKNYRCVHSFLACSH